MVKEEIMIEQRSKVRHFSGATIFSTKIRCGECGGWYGSKVWHSTDKYRKVIWQCNAKFRDKTRCKTPHLTEEDIKNAFISVMNQLIGGKEEILAELRSVMETLSGTEELVREQKQLAEQMNADAEAVQELIAENARKAQDQETYTLRYEALVSRFEETKAKHAQVSQEITLRGIRRREFGRFIAEVEKLPQAITEFDETLWGSMVDHLTVHSRDNIVFTLTGGMEIKA